MNLSESLRRPNWLAELRGILLFAAVATGAAGVAATVTTLSGQLQAEVTNDALQPGTLVGAPPGVRLGSSIPVEITDPGPAQVGWAMLATLPRFVLILTALVVLWRAVDRAHRDGPFRTGLAGSLHTLGLLLTVGGLFTWVAESMARFALSMSVDVGGTSAVLDLTVPFVWVLAGIGMFAIGEIVRRGQAMRTELDGVV